MIAVIGVDCIGSPMDDEHVHRAGIFRARLGRPPEAVVTPDDVAAIVLHPEGYLARVSPSTRVFVFISKATTGPAHEQARQIAVHLEQHDRGKRIGRILIGDVREHAFAAT